jgi:hypothetical protein
MPRAVLKNGTIQPLEPLPPEWKEGQELIVEEAKGPDLRPAAIDEWAEELDALASESDPEDEARMREAIEEHRRQGKAWVRREMGLPE